MTRRYLFVLTVLPVLVVAGRAAAMKVDLESVDGKTTETEEPINLEQCERNITLKFRVTNDLPSKYLFVMRGSECNTDRSGDNTNTCTVVFEGKMDTLLIDVPLTTKQLGLECGSSDSDIHLYFLGQASESDKLNESTDFVELTLAVDTVPPPAPTNVEGGEGEHSIPIDWEFEGADVETFRVYYERVSNCPQGSVLCDYSPGCASNGDGTASETTADDAGVEPNEEVTAEVDAVDYDEVSSSLRSHDLMDVVGIGETAAVAVVAVDEAGNQSLASNVVCIEGVATVGFCEINENMGGKCESGCSVGPGPGAHPGRLPAALLVLLAVACIRFRRRDEATFVR
jgi:MYXO-CTERM domain-containing protein